MCRPGLWVHELTPARCMGIYFDHHFLSPDASTVRSVYVQTGSAIFLIFIIYFKIIVYLVMFRSFIDFIS